MSLVQGEVMVGVRHSLPVSGIGMILGNDVATKCVCPGSVSPVVQKLMRMFRDLLNCFQLVQ